jgi:hypothetical protein
VKCILSANITTHQQKAKLTTDSPTPPHRKLPHTSNYTQHNRNNGRCCILRTSPLSRPVYSSAALVLINTTDQVGFPHHRQLHHGDCQRHCRRSQGHHQRHCLAVRHHHQLPDVRPRWLQGTQDYAYESSLRRRSPGRCSGEKEM